MRTAVVGATAAILIVATPAMADIDRFDFPSRTQLAQALDLDRPGKIHVNRSPVDEYFGVVPKRCDITYHLRTGTENLQTSYGYRTSKYWISPSIEIRRYASTSAATQRFRDVRQRLVDCAGRTYKDPPNMPTGGKVRIDRYNPPRIGTASFGLTSSYCCEGGPAKSRIIVSRVGNTIIWTQGMNYGSDAATMPSAAAYVQLARLATRLGQ